jgi:hypothetical protein
MYIFEQTFCHVSYQGTPSPYAKGITDDIKANLQCNQRVLVKMCLQIDPHRIVPAFGKKNSWDCSETQKSIWCFGELQEQVLQGYYFFMGGLRK